jgi:hypothetical protein
MSKRLTLRLAYMFAIIVMLIGAPLLTHAATAQPDEDTSIAHLIKKYAPVKDLQKLGQIQELESLGTTHKAFSDCATSAFNVQDKTSALTQLQGCQDRLTAYQQVVNEMAYADIASTLPIEKTFMREVGAVDAYCNIETSLFNFFIALFQYETNTSASQQDKVAAMKQIQGEMKDLIAQNSSFMSQNKSTQFYRGMGGTSSFQSQLKNYRAIQTNLNKIAKALLKSNPAPTQTIKTGKLQTIPSNTTSTTKPVILGPASVQGTAGQSMAAVQYSAQYGLAPYHYQLETMGGFPPHGVVLSPSGLLSGTPAVSGTTLFKACVVDSAGFENCMDVTVTVNNPNEPAPQPTATQTNTSATQTTPPTSLPSTGGGTGYSLTGSGSCGTCSWGGKCTMASGNASGPVGSVLYLEQDYVLTCGSWTQTNSSCQRDAGQPESTSWSVPPKTNGGVDIDIGTSDFAIGAKRLNFGPCY